MCSVRAIKIFLIFAAWLFLPLAVPQNIAAQESDLNIHIEPLQLQLAPPKIERLFIEFATVGIYGLSHGGGHNEGVGGAIETSYIVFSTPWLALRPAVDLTVIRSRTSGGQDDIDVTDSSAHAVFYLDIQAGRIRPYIGIGGGYDYLQEELKNDAGGNVDDEAGTAVLVGHLGASWRVQEKAGWFFSFGYSYIYGLNNIQLATREGRLDVSNHRVRFGLRIGF